MQQANPFTRIFASPLRYCALTKIYMPRDFMISFREAVEPSIAKTYMVPYPILRSPTTTYGRKRVNLYCNKTVIERAHNMEVTLSSRLNFGKHLLPHTLELIGMLLRERVAQEVEDLSNSNHLHAVPTAISDLPKEVVALLKLESAASYGLLHLAPSNSYLPINNIPIFSIKTLMCSTNTTAILPRSLQCHISKRAEACSQKLVNLLNQHHMIGLSAGAFELIRALWRLRLWEAPLDALQTHGHFLHY